MALFDTEPYEIPMEEQLVYMGEHPPMMAEDWERIAEQMREERNGSAMDEAWRKADAARRRGMVLGQLSLMSYE